MTDPHTISSSSLEDLKERLTRNRLEASDITLLLAIIQYFVTLRLLLQKRRISILKFLRKIFGLKTEKRPATSPRPAPSEKASGAGRRGRNGREDYPGAEKEVVPHATLSPGCTCPECQQGVLREAEPAVDYDWHGSAPLLLKIYFLQRLLCHSCKTVFTAQSPVAEAAKTVDDSSSEDKVGRCNRNAMANTVVAILRFWYGVAHYRLAKIQGAMGMALPVATQYKMVLQVFYAAWPIYMHLLEVAAQGALLHADDTSIKILDWLAGKGPPNKSVPGNKKTAQTTAIVSRMADGRSIRLYLTNGDQAGTTVALLLSKRDPQNGPPIYMCDGLAANIPGKDYLLIQVHCLDHARRNFFDLQKIYPKETSYVLDQLKYVYKADREAKEQKLSPEQRMLYHQQHSQKVIEEMGRWCELQLFTGLVEENSDLGKAIIYCLKRWSELTEFLHTPGVPLSNSECEQSIKSIIRHRKNSLAYKTAHGAQVGDVIQSLIATCEQAGVNIFSYLEWIQRHRSLVEVEPAQFTPWLFKEAVNL